MSTSLMGLGLKAMTSSYAALQTSGHNIANANLAGYSRQQVNLETSPAIETSRGFFGRGVDIESVTRLHDKFLTREALGTKSMAAMDAARLTHLQQLENVFKTGELGLGHASSELMSSLLDLSSPTSGRHGRSV